MLRDGKISIIAIYAEGEKEVWNTVSNSLPSAWINGYSPENGIEQEEIYILRRTPTLYLLNADNTVALKDSSVEQIIEYISRISK